jgi:hypothetical protein
LSPDQEFCFEIGGSGHQHVQSGAVEWIGGEICMLDRTAFE